MTKDTAAQLVYGASVEIEGSQEVTWSVTCDTDELKTEGEIQDIYSKIQSLEGSYKKGKLHADALGLIVDAEVIENAGVDCWTHVEEGKFVPYFMLITRGQYVAGVNSSARAIEAVWLCKANSFAFTLGQDGYAEIEFDWQGKFTDYQFAGNAGRLLSLGGSNLAGTLEDDTVYYPHREHLPLWAPDASQGFAGRTTSSSIIQQRAYKSETVGDFVEWVRPLADGPHLINFKAELDTNRGTVAVKVNGGLVAQVVLGTTLQHNYPAMVAFTIPEGNHGFQTIRLEVVSGASGDLVELSDVELLSQNTELKAAVNTWPVQASAAIGIPAFQYDADETSPTPAVVDSATNAGEKIEQNGLASTMVFYRILEAGTYSIDAVIGKGSDYGVIAFDVDGVPVGTYDGYNGSTLTPVLTAIPGTFEVKRRKRVKITLACTSRNPASDVNGYKMLLAWLGLRRTSADALNFGQSGKTGAIYLPWNADASAGWSGSAASVLRNWATVSDGVAGRKLVWKDGLQKATYRAVLGAEIEAGGAPLELHFGGAKVADLSLAGTPNNDGRVEATFTLSAAALSDLELVNPSTTAATVYYLHLDRVS
jgi:hypothetical protein